MTSDTSKRDGADGWRVAQRTLRKLLGLDARETLCKDCGEPMMMSTTYHPVLFEHVPSWVCEACGRTVVRDDGPGDEFTVDGEF